MGKKWYNSIMWEIIDFSLNGGLMWWSHMDGWDGSLEAKVSV